MPTSTLPPAPMHRLEQAECIPLQAAADPIQQPPAKARSTAAATRGAGARANARRLSPQLRKLLVAAHVLVAVGWFGVVVAKLVLEIWTVTTRDQELPRVAYAIIEVFDRAVFPPMAVGTLLTGIILSLGTAWGLFRHYWIVAKLVLTVAVIVTGVVFVGAWVEQAIATGSETASMSLVSASLAHLLMLGAATVISVYKPWGRIRPDRRDPVPRRARTSTNRAA
jgi:hypothetical protein